MYKFIEKVVMAIAFIGLVIAFAFVVIKEMFIPTKKK